MLTLTNTYTPPGGSSPPSDTYSLIFNLTWENAPENVDQMFDFPLWKLLAGSIGQHALQLLTYFLIRLNLYVIQTGRIGNHGASEVHPR